MQIRKAVSTDASAIARVHVDSWRTTYRGIVPDSYLASLSYEQRTSQWKQSLENDGFFVFVAEDEMPKQIIGFASGGEDRSRDTEYAGELGAIYLLEGYRRKGIGQKLVVTLVRTLLDNGYSSMLVWVLAENPYRKFYEKKLGGKYLRSKQIEIGGSRYEEVVYGWKDLGALIVRLRSD
jgi:L-amino acid N-acyltransferase YncA